MSIKGVSMIAAQDKRRTEPSYTIPFVFEGFEIALIWITFSIYEGSFNVQAWSAVSYFLAAVWCIHTLYKLRKVLIRQLAPRKMKEMRAV